MELPELSAFCADMTAELERRRELERQRLEAESAIRAAMGEYRRLTANFEKANFKQRDRVYHEMIRAFKHEPVRTALIGHFIEKPEDLRLGVTRKLFEAVSSSKGDYKDLVSRCVLFHVKKAIESTSESEAFEAADITTAILDLLGATERLNEVNRLFAVRFGERYTSDRVTRAPEKPKPMPGHPGKIREITERSPLNGAMRDQLRSIVAPAANA